MKWAILSDVHANAKALRAVLAEVRADGCGKILCLGDVVGYGPSPAETVALVREHCDATILGNHDAAVAGRMWTDDFIDRANDSASSHRQQLDADAVAWLKALPYLHEERDFACAHGDFAHPERFGYVSDAEDAVASWNVRTEPLLFVGHTHNALVHVVGASGAPHRMVPQDFTLEEGKRYVVNPGSVGWPRNGSHRASWATYDDAKKVVAFHSLDLDALPAGAPGRGWRIALAAIALAAGAGAFFALQGRSAGAASAAGTGASAGADAAAEAVAPVAGARPWGAVARTVKCSVSASARKLSMSVKLAKKSPKAFVRMVFMDANGGDMTAGEKWWPDVAKSRKGSVPVPDGATAARVEVCAARANEPAPEIVDVKIGK